MGTDTQISGTNPVALTAADFDNDGLDEIVLSLAGFGVFSNDRTLGGDTQLNGVVADVRTQQ